jgi:mannan endo-1,4-beta-mannosidase
VRSLALNLLTSAVTLVLLAALTLPATRILQEDRASAVTRAPVDSPRRTFGVYVDPWHVDDWGRGVGEPPQMVAKFEAFSRGRTVDDFLAETERQGVRQVMVTWEPWKPVPTSLGTALQYLEQPGYRNVDILRGAQDAYIQRFARSLAAFHGTVWLRYAHEMNGFWYPWSHGRRNYVRAWRHVVGLVRRAGARNVRFVWSPNANLFQAQAAWWRWTRGYWPGAHWVDAVGSTMINFGGSKRYDIARFVPRLALLRRGFRKPVMLAETNTAFAGRVAWLRDLRAMLRVTPWIRAVAWSQLPSRGTAHTPGSGNLNWDVSHDPPAAAILRAIIRDGER